MSEVELEILSEIQEEAKAWSAKKKKMELTALCDEAANATIQEMHRLICDVSVSASEAFPAVLKIMEEVGYQLDGFKQVNRLLELFTEMSNHTRMPSNRGFTPKEIIQKMGGALKQIEFGSGILQFIQQGEIDGNELKRSIVGEGSIPLEMRASLLRKVDRAMEKRGKRDEK